MESNKKILPRTKDNISFLYLEYIKIEREDYAIVAIRAEQKILIPIAVINVLLLGPGTSITHGAINVISASGCNIVWCGDHMTRFYSFDAAEIKNSKNILKQIEFFSDEEKRLYIVRNMYKKRFNDIDVNSLSLNELRGIEGIKIKEAYKFYAKMYKVKWTYRNYKVSSLDEQDQINRIITVLNQMLYAICHGIILSLGFSPSIGFIHSGNIESFVFDVADFYKEIITIPLAFKIHSSINSENLQYVCRSSFRNIVVEKKLMSQISKDLLSLFSTDEKENDYSINEIWDVNELLSGGINYGGDEFL